MGGRILVVDDNRDAANALARLLAVRGYEAKVAYGGSEALEVAAGFPFDMAFIDIGMPDLNGYETAAKLRQIRASSDVIFVALTGWSREEDKKQAYDAGFHVHVAKPMGESQLAELLALLKPQPPGTTSQ
jgi:two-component system, sensor histidine kinase